MTDKDKCIRIVTAMAELGISNRQIIDIIDAIANTISIDDNGEHFRTLRDEFKNIRILMNKNTKLDDVMNNRIEHFKTHIIYSCNFEKMQKDTFIHSCYHAIKTAKIPLVQLTAAHHLKSREDIEILKSGFKADIKNPEISDKDKEIARISLSALNAIKKSQKNYFNSLAFKTAAYNAMYLAREKTKEYKCNFKTIHHKQYAMMKLRL